MAVTTPEQTMLDILQDKATRLRIDSVRSTTAARQWASDELRLGGGDHVRPVLFRAAV